jgi:PKD repeat protein
MDSSTGKTVNVSDAAGLMKALAGAAGGDVIVLQGGDYGRLSLTDQKNFFADYASQVTIVSADPGNPAVFTSLMLKGIDNLKFDSVKFDYKAVALAKTTVAPFTLEGCTKITIANSEFDGDVTSGYGAKIDGYGTGRGLSISYSSEISIVDNEIHNFHRGVLTSKSQNIVISGNDLHDLSSDGLDFAQVNNVLIKGNHIHDLKRPADSLAHPDMIQFWTKGTTAPSTNIKIVDNFLDAGSGAPSQSIFMRNEAVDSYGGGVKMFYHNVTIANNVIRNGHLHGITVGETNNLKIDNNTLLQSTTMQAGGSISAPSINVAASSTNVVVTDNVLPTLPAGLAAHKVWTVSNNVIVQRDELSSDNYVGKIYADALDTTNPTMADFQALPGSLGEIMNAGSTLGSGIGAGKYSGAIASDHVNGSPMKQSFEVAHVYTYKGDVDLAGATAKWNFGDGTVGTGLSTAHSYAKPGTYNATASVTLANGKTVLFDKTVVIESGSILEANFNSTAADLSPFANAAILKSATLVAGGAGHGQAVKLNGGTLAYDANSEFFKNEEYTLVADFKKEAGQENAGGRLIYFSGSFVVTLGADNISVAVQTSKGTTTLKADKLGIADTDWHRFALTFSGETGLAKIYMDGKEVGSVGGLAGAIQEGGRNADFFLGGPFGGSFGGLIDNVHFIGAALPIEAISAAKPLEALAAINLFEDDAVSAYALSKSVSPVQARFAGEPADSGAVALSLAPPAVDADFRIV